MKKFVFIILSVLIIFSCNRKKYLISDVNGSVKLFDQTVKINDLQGMKVVLSNYEDTAVTDENGLYYFEKVPIGTYEVTFIKEGYPKLSLNNFQIIGNGQEIRHIPHVNIIALPTIEVKNFRDTAINNFYSDIKANIIRNGVNAGEEIALIAYISSKSNVSKNNYERKKLIITEKNYILLQTDFGIGSGEYVVFYSCPYFDYGCSTMNDTVIFYGNFLMQTDENGKTINPYYKQISSIYQYNNK